MTRTVGTHWDVIDAFIAGRPLRTRAAQVPGGARVRSISALGEDANVTHELLSYRTAQAFRLRDGRIGVTTAKYSPTTSKLVTHLLRAMREAGYEVQVTNGLESDIVFREVALPGRHGGFGIPWASSSWRSVPFVLYRKRS